MAVDAYTSPRRGTNVLAESRGRGRSVVMAGAHLDSVPAGPGINDNGSGVAALLGLAESAGSSAPGAPIRLAFWGAEELGLYGSRRYVAALSPAERQRIRAYVNLDMVGSRNAVRAVYAAKDSARRIRNGSQRIENVLNGLVKPTEHSSGASDHVPFARAGIPVGGVFTGASQRGPGGRPSDSCYHLACDRLANVDVPWSCGLPGPPGARCSRCRVRRSRRRGPARRTAQAAARPRTSWTRPPRSPAWRSARRTRGRPARSR